MAEVMYEAEVVRWVKKVHKSGKAKEVILQELQAAGHTTLTIADVEAMIVMKREYHRREKSSAKHKGGRPRKELNGKDPARMVGVDHSAQGLVKIFDDVKNGFMAIIDDQGKQNKDLRRALIASRAEVYRMKQERRMEISAEEKETNVKDEEELKEAGE